MNRVPRRRAKRSRQSSRVVRKPPSRWWYVLALSSFVIAGGVWLYQSELLTKPTIPVQLAKPNERSEKTRTQTPPTPPPSTPDSEPRLTLPPQLPSRDTMATPPPSRRRKRPISDNLAKTTSLPPIPKTAHVLSFTEHPPWASIEGGAQARFLWGANTSFDSAEGSTVRASN